MVSETRKTGSVGWQGERQVQNSFDHSVLSLSSRRSRPLHISFDSAVRGYHVRSSTGRELRNELTVRQGTQIMST